MFAHVPSVLQDEPRGWTPTPLFEWHLETDFSCFVDSLVQPLIYQFQQQSENKCAIEQKPQTLVTQQHITDKQQHKKHTRDG